jgi:PHS family inorganic phosphate transporter-like MFS transporter
MVGQLLFGFLADLYGRRKLYGVELLITIAATLGVLMCSSGADGSMKVEGWFIVWRCIMGLGIGADYPLSAVICSEYAPTRCQ